MAERIVYKRSDGTWAWKLTVNGRIVATDAGQGYANEFAAREMSDRIISGTFANAEKKTDR